MTEAVSAEPWISQAVLLRYAGGL